MLLIFAETLCWWVVWVLYWVAFFFLLKEKEILYWCILLARISCLVKNLFLFCLLLCFCNVFATLATHRIHTRKTKTFAKKGMAAVVIYLMYLWWTFVGSWRRGIVLSIVQHIGGKEETMIHIGITNESFEKEKFNHCTAFKGGINLLTPLGNP